MNNHNSRILIGAGACTALGLIAAACNVNLPAKSEETRVEPLRFGAEIYLGRPEANPGAPFLRYSPDGRLSAVWTEDDAIPWPQGQPAGRSQAAGKEAPSPMRNAYIGISSDGGVTWSGRRRVNSEGEAVQGEENGPRVAFDVKSRAHVIWSIPGEKGDKTRANIRSAMEDGKGGFTRARTLNEVKDAARFPIIETAPDGTFLIAWIDRRNDHPQPRRLYLMRIAHDGAALTRNYSAGEGLCECCKLGIAFAEGGKTVYVVDRQVDEKKIRNHVLRKSTDGGASFAVPVEISDDGWQVGSCPHSGPSIGRDSRGWLHVSWFTLGRSEREAGIYYSVSKDGGKSFAPKQIVHANTAPETLYNNLIVGDDDTIYLAWTNIDEAGKAQVYMRTLDPDGRVWSPIRQISRATGNANRPVLALRKNHLHVAWTETDGEASRAFLRSATVGL